MAHQFQEAKILQRSHSRTAENFDSFLREQFVAVRQVAHGSLRAVGILQRDDHVIIRIAAIIRQAARLHFNGSRSCQEAQEIDEVADLAKNPASTLLGIVDPVVGCNVARVHAIVHGQGLAAFREE